MFVKSGGETPVGELTTNLEADVYPSCKEGYDTPMFCFGAEPLA